jgi:hypothetical protein
LSVTVVGYSGATMPDFHRLPLASSISAANKLPPERQFFLAGTMSNAVRAFEALAAGA